MCHYTRIPIPWYPYPYTHGTPYLLHTYMHAFVLFIYLIVFVFVYLIVFVSLTLLFSLVLSPLALSLPPWQGLPLGRGSRSYLSCARQCFILFNYYPVVYMCGMVCMYLNVLYSVCVCIIYYTCVQQMYVCTQCGVYYTVCMRPCVCVVVYMLCCVVWTTCAWYTLSTQHVCITYILYIVYYLFFSMFVYNKKALCIVHNAYLKLILISKIFYLFQRAYKMRGHPVAPQNSGNTFVVCFSDTSEIKKSLRVSKIV